MHFTTTRKQQFIMMTLHSKEVIVLGRWKFSEQVAPAQNEEEITSYSKI